MDKTTASSLQRRRLHILILVFLGLLVYSNTFGVPFHFDDYIFLEHQEVKTQLALPEKDVAPTFNTIRGPWASRPLLYATFVINHSLDGFNTWSYHLVNLVFHVLNGILLYFLVLITGRHLGYGETDIVPVALLSSALFVLHPIQTEAVTNIVNRSMLMATAAYLSGLILFFKAVTSEDRIKVRYTVGLFFAALLGTASRENFATFPIMLFIYDLFFVSRFRPRAMVGHYRAYIAALFGIALLGYLVYTNTYGNYEDFQDIAISPLQYVLTQFKVQWIYIRLLLFPANQNIAHDVVLAKSLFESPTFLGFIGYVGLWAGGLLLAHRKPVVSFGLLWFLITLAPISFGVALLNLRLGDPMFEHRLYLPSAGPLLLAALALVRVARWRRALVPAVAAICIVLGAAAYARNSVWIDGIMLWADAAGKSPESYRAHNNLGLSYSQRGLHEKALEHLEAAMRIQPANAKGLVNIGAVYIDKGQPDRAIDHLEAAIKLVPDFRQAHTNLGIAYLMKEQYEKAQEHFLEASRLSPDNPELLNAIAGIYAIQGQKEEAIKYYISSLWLNTAQPKVLASLSVLFIETGQTERAIKHLEALAKLSAGHLPTLMAIAKLCLKNDLPLEAVKHLKTALILSPDDAEIHRMLAEAYGALGNSGKAKEHLLRSESLEKTLLSNASSTE